MNVIFTEFFYCYFCIIIADYVYKNTQVKLYMQLYFTFSFFVLCIDFYVARMQTKFC